MNARRRHERLQEMLLRARELESAERSDFLAGACGDDSELRRDIDRLLAHDENPISLVAAPFGEESGQHALRAGLEALLDEGSEAPADTALPRSIGKFRIRGKLGEGGMGAVYEAEQEHPHRTVALKILRPAFLSADSLRRFEQEGEFLARLQHPGIAQIFDSGSAETEHGPQPFFAMELVRGVPLTEYARNATLSTGDRLELFARVADAVQHAHQQGVIHRDLKPANILVDPSGQPKVLDFGVARATDSDVQLATLQTDVGQILGTLAYMSPEQASGDPRAIDTRSDVYSLGVLLFELLTDELPYDVSSKLLPEAVRAIQEEEPRRLSNRRAGLAGDVETITRKALEKDRSRRYASAAALASDIRRFLRHEPIHARPASRLYTLGKFVRRNKTMVGAASMVFVALLVGLIVSLRFGMSEAKQRRMLERDNYHHDMARTLESLSEGNFTAAREHHDQPEHLRNWEWRHLGQRWIQELTRVTVPDVVLAAFRSEMRVVAIDGSSGVHVWDLTADEGTSARHTAPASSQWPRGARPLALSADGRWLLTHHDGALALGDPLGTGAPQRVPFPEGMPRLDPRASAIAVDGARVAVTTEANEVILVDVGRGSRVVPGERLMSEVLSVEFPPGGLTLAVTCESGLRVWSLDDLAFLYSGRNTVAFSPAQTLFIEEARGEGGSTAGLSLKDAANGERLGKILARYRYGIHHSRACQQAAFGPDGRLLALRSGETISLLEVSATPESGIRARSVGSLYHLDDIRFTFSPSGTRVLTLGRTDHTLRLWGAGVAAGARVCVGHGSYVYSVAFSPDGATVASGSWDRSVRLWDAASGEPIVSLLGGNAVLAVAFSPDGKHIARKSGGKLEVLSVARGHVVALLPNNWGTFRRLSRTPIWNTKALAELSGSSEADYSPIFAFDAGGTLLARGWKTSVTLLDLASDEVKSSAIFPDEWVTAVAFDPRTDRLVVGFREGTISFLAVPSLTETSQMSDHGGEVFAVAFSPDGTRIASGGRDGLLRVWDAETGDLLVRLEGHGEYIKSLAFSPDGRRIATGSGDGTVRIWDSEPAVERWKEVREIHRARPGAERLVERLYAELADPGAVVARLEEDEDLDPLLRRLALRAVLRREVAARNESEND